MSKIQRMGRTLASGFPIGQHRGLAFRGSAGIFAFLRDESGQDLIEYALIVGLIGLGAIVALKGLSTALSTAFSRFGSTLISSA